MKCSYQDVDVRNCKECANCRTCPVMKIYIELIDIREMLGKLIESQCKGR